MIISPGQDRAQFLLDNEGQSDLREVHDHLGNVEAGAVQVQCVG